MFPSPASFPKKSDFYLIPGHVDINSDATYYLVTALQSSSHYRDISNALKTIINSTIGKINENLLYWFFMVFWIHKLSDTKVLCCRSQFAWKNKNIMSLII